ncbi:MAG: hypothetical protein CTY29_11820 [Methylobacter sp.]|nr:MAG: hypothetical protein CTY29_11820 [Methylobacter sp.]PPD23897.1 MAG: hypothetical protein CTY24_02875 [Methylobacter sp.]
MPNTKKILLVEGEADKGFFVEICKKLNLTASVMVAPPKDLGGTHNTKNGVINHLNNALLPQLADGTMTHIAAIVDADYEEHNGSYSKTLDRLSKVVAPFGFTLEPDQVENNGLCFKNSDGLADFGLWIMPRNQHAGMLEDWVKSCIDEDEQALFEHAANVVQQLATPKFPPHKISKAEVATWLAWQKEPGHGLYHLVTEGLLNRQRPLFVELEQWLQKVFADLPEQ